MPRFHVIIAVFLGFLLDCLVGDPEKLPHPVRFMGSGIAFFDRLLRKNEEPPLLQRLKGALLICLIVFATAASSWLLIFAFRFLHPLAALAVETLLCAQCLAARNLRDEAMRVYHRLKAGSLADARRAVARIVGRDTDRLDEAGVIRAAVETVAENTTDGVIAPLFYLVLGGPVLGMVYKAVNTMDSMIAYKNERYRFFGTAAARSDDVANFIPARLAALAMLAASFLLRFDAGSAWRIFRRDRYKHESPNAAQTESACAGALGIRLAGDAYYGGKLEHKPTLGDALRPPEAQDIPRATGLMYVATVLCLLAFLLIRLAVAVLYYNAL